MADDEFEEEDSAVDEESDGEENDDEGEGSRGSNKKLLIIIGLVVLLLIGAAAAVFFTGLLDPLFGGAETSSGSGGEGKDGAAEKEEVGGGVFYALPEMIVTLNTGGRKPVFLKIKVSLEVQSSDDISKLQATMPRIVDKFQVYLRELRIDDLKGSAGMYRLREELLARVKVAAHPAKVNAVLFKEMLVQ
ncbi:MAG: flagellar basal body-associated FliL family protein [Rhodospirillales bacterium]|nr:flagellar basal body-associated FliL family protein [Rhodospirillales bacterium]